MSKNASIDELPRKYPDEVLPRVLPSGLEELGGFRRRREVVGDLTVINSDEGLCICTETECDRFVVDNMKEFASDLERDLDELCKNEKHRTQLKEETLSHREGCWRVPQVTDHKIELQGLDGEFRLWERGVRVFERERESWRVSQVTEHEIELQGVDGEFRLWEKGVRVFERERESWRVSQLQGVDGEIWVWEKGCERLHYMLERVWEPILVPGSPKRISHFFLNVFETWHSFDTNPLLAFFFKNP
ncbi:hypothetical protein DY000_02013506 [Brassica cretica]|uniref:Uncharacterized protein n=1 Tax=Brassica cretica TaxID=69181 RepID=A0ABQ7CQX4_BRACR|nr:hypothetical protein DY000_02013506 [Brassica cretica]